MHALSSIRPPSATTATAGLTPGEKVNGADVSIPTAELRELNAGGSLTSAAGAKPANASFSGMLGQLIQEVNAKQNTAAQALQDLQSGRSGSLHHAMIASEEASVSFQLMVEVRNRVLDAYQELMRMQV